MLAQAGLLDDCRVTTPWEDQADLARAFPALSVVPDVSWVDEGDVVTSGGISAGIDMTLHLAQRLHSRALAERNAHQMESRWTRALEHDLVYHTNITGRLWANTDQGHPATFEATEIGALLPSNSPLELSVQYRSVIAFGTSRVLTDLDEQRAALTTLSERVFRDLSVGREMRPILDSDLARTSVYSLKIERWSGKENWQNAAVQDDAWPALTPRQARRRPTQKVHP